MEKKMKIQKLSLLLLLTVPYNYSDSKPTIPQNIPVSSDFNFNDLKATLEKYNALLEQQNKLTTALLTCMLRNAQQEQALLEVAQKEIEIQKAYEQQKQMHLEQQRQEEENKPWWEKVLHVSTHIVTGYVVTTLWPTIKFRLTARLTDEILSITCNGVDMITGDFIEKQWNASYATRPGEWFLKTPQGRQQAQNKRDLKHSHPDIEGLVKQRNALKKELYPDALRSSLQAEIQYLNALKEFHNQQRAQQFNDDQQRQPEHSSNYGQQIITLQNQHPIIVEEVN